MRSQVGDEGEAEKAVKQCFKDWLKARGSLGNLEIQKLLSDIRACIEAHQESRFSVVGAIDARPIINRIGYIKEEEGERFILFSLKCLSVNSAKVTIAP